MPTIYSHSRAPQLRAILGPLAIDQAQLLIEGPQQRMLSATASTAEIVQIQCPNHSAAQTQLSGEARLAPNVLHIIVREPLLAALRIRPNAAGRIANHRPAAAVYALADFVVGEKAGGAREFASLAGPR